MFINVYLKLSPNQRFHLFCKLNLVEFYYVDIDIFSNSAHSRYSVVVGPMR
jgi:hypothetical protein